MRNAKLSRSRKITTSEDGLETKIGTLRAWSMFTSLSSSTSGVIGPFVLVLGYSNLRLCPEYARSSPRCKRSVGPHFLASKRPRLLHWNPKKKTFLRRSSYEDRSTLARSSWLHIAINCSKIVMLWARVHAFDVEPYARSILSIMLLRRPRCNITRPSSSRTQVFLLALALPREDIDVDVVPETSSVLFYLDLVAT